MFQPDPHGRGKKLSVLIDQDEIEKERSKAIAEEQLVMDLIGMWTGYCRGTDKEGIWW